MPGVPSLACLPIMIPWVSLGPQLTCQSLRLSPGLLVGYVAGTMGGDVPYGCWITQAGRGEHPGTSFALVQHAPHPPLFLL